MRIFWITLAVVFVDQATKLAVLRFMRPHQSIPVLGDWLRLTFTENPGMAFGITFGPRGAVTIFAIAATVLILLYLFRIRNGYWPYRASLALILGGALGNIIDRVFYGYLFAGDGFFVGKVVDFIHVNIWRGYIPEQIPVFGGSYVALFPIWNVADMAIVAGVVGILLFQHAFHEQMYGHAHEGGAALEPDAATSAGQASGLPADASQVSVSSYASSPAAPDEAPEHRSEQG